MRKNKWSIATFIVFWSIIAGLVSTGILAFPLIFPEKTSTPTKATWEWKSKEYGEDGMPYSGVVYYEARKDNRYDSWDNPSNRAATEGAGLWCLPVDLLRQSREYHDGWVEFRFRCSKGRK